MTFTAANPSRLDLVSLPQKEHTVIPGPSGRSIKILHIINDLSIGGAEIMLLRLLSHKSRERFEPSVLSLMDQGPLRARIEELGIPVYTAGMKPGRPTPASIWRLVRLARQIKPHLIQGWLYHGSLAAQLAGLSISRKVPVLWSIHCSIYSLKFEKKLTAAVMRLCAPFSKLAAKIVFVSGTSQAQHKQLGYSTRRSCVIPNGIDTKLFSPSEEARASVRKELGLPSKALLIGVIGRYHAMKDHANFLRAAAEIAKGHPHVHFLLGGREVDRDNRALAELIEELCLQPRTHLLGERSDIARLVAALDIFALSSGYGESFPIIVGEAMSCGVPCVVTDVGDSAGMVGETGRVVPPRDHRALAAACEGLLRIGREGRLALGEAARSRMATLFSLSSIVARYEELYLSSVAAASTDTGGEPDYQNSGELYSEEKAYKAGGRS
jgi:glycosyltransferase involved in cell wall biosynthesis